MTLAGAAAGRRDPLDAHVRRVDQVAAIAPPPKAWTELRERLNEFSDFYAVPLRERLIVAVLGGTSDDLPMLKALAMAEASGSRTDVLIDVRAAVYPKLVQLYSEVAAINYAKVAKEFDTVASDFTALAKQCNPEVDGASIVGEPDSVRSAWLDAQKFAAGLDKLTPVLQAAAELYGIYTGDDTALLPLVIDTTGLHRRRVWEAWKSSGERCGHWSALAALGARIRACDLEEFEPYRTPKPLIHKQFPIPGPGNRGIYRPEIIDPEDEDYVPPEEEPKPRRRVLTR